nr:hypothetical protein Iba_chr09eCG14610 [Ipomoea batatas]
MHWELGEGSLTAENAFGGKTLEKTETAYSEIRGLLKANKRTVAVSRREVFAFLPATFTLGIRMSTRIARMICRDTTRGGRSSQRKAFSPSTGGSTFNQIDEVEHAVSPIAEENKAAAYDPRLLPEDVSSSGRGKSPQSSWSRRRFLHLSPRTVEEIAVSMTPEGVPSRAAEPPVKNPRPEAFVPDLAHSRPGRSESSAN